MAAVPAPATEVEQKQNQKQLSKEQRADDVIFLGPIEKSIGSDALKNLRALAEAIDFSAIKAVSLMQDATCRTKVKIYFYCFPGCQSFQNRYLKTTANLQELLDILIHPIADIVMQYADDIEITADEWLPVTRDHMMGLKHEEGYSDLLSKWYRFDTYDDFRTPRQPKNDLSTWLEGKAKNLECNRQPLTVLSLISACDTWKAEDKRDDSVPQVALPSFVEPARELVEALKKIAIGVSSFAFDDEGIYYHNDDGEYITFVAGALRCDPTNVLVMALYFNSWT